MIDTVAPKMWLAVLIGWLGRLEREALAYLIEENRILRAQLAGRRLRLTDDDRRRLTVRAFRLGRQALRQVAPIVTPDTLLTWHRQLIARNICGAQVACGSECDRGGVLGSQWAGFAQLF